MKMEKVTVSFKKLKKLVEVLEKSDFKPEDPIAFEFIIGSLFPRISDNIKKEIKRQHAAGYAEGLQAQMKRKES